MCTSSIASIRFRLIIFVTLFLARLLASRDSHVVHHINNYQSSSLSRTKGDERTTLRRYSVNNEELHKLLKLNGGDTVVKEKKSILKKFKGAIESVQPATRTYLLLCLFCTAVHTTGLPAPTLFNLDINRLHEIWRPFTSVSYFGAPSMSMANSIYFLLKYGQTLESSLGTGTQAWFLLVQTFLLTAMGLTIGFPFQAQAMISAIVYASSRINPVEQIPVQFGLVITAWQLPYMLMFIDCLSQQKVEAAWPHILGILSGHIYHFYTTIWPALGGRARLVPPEWILQRFGGKPVSNIQSKDFRRFSTAHQIHSNADEEYGGTLNRSSNSRKRKAKPVKHASKLSSSRAKRKGRSLK